MDGADYFPETDSGSGKEGDPGCHVPQRQAGVADGDISRSAGLQPKADCVLLTPLCGCFFAVDFHSVPRIIQEGNLRVDRHRL